MKKWTIQKAKARFDELVDRACEAGPQMVACRGEEAVVVMGIEDYRKLTRQRRRNDLVRFFQKSPLAEVDPEFFVRDRDSGSEIKL